MEERILIGFIVTLSRFASHLITQQQRYKCNQLKRQYHQRMLRMVARVQVPTYPKRKRPHPSSPRHKTKKSFSVTTQQYI